MVSIIIPNYNHSRYLDDRIKSVLNQTYQDFEVIILDDCSTDDSREIINNYKGHPKISQIVFNEENSGSTFKQWQKGFNLAKGEYIWIAESDDVAHPDFLNKLMDVIAGDKSITLAASGITFIDETGKETGQITISKTRNPRIYDSSTFIKENMLLGNHLLNASSAIFRKDALINLPETYNHLCASGDYLFWLEIANKGRVAEIPDKLDYFRKYSTSVTPRLYGNGKTFEEALVIFDRLKELGYVKGLYRNVVVGFRLNQIRKGTKFNSEEVRERCMMLWKNRSKIPIFDYTALGVYGIWRRIKRFFRNLR